MCFVLNNYNLDTYMNFTSFEFLFLFFPVTIVINYLLPPVVRNYWILAASLFFYSWGAPEYLLLFILSIVINFSFGLLIEKVNEAAEKNNYLPGEQFFENTRTSKLPFLKGVIAWLKNKFIGLCKNYFLIRKIIFVIAIFCNVIPLFLTKYLNVITELAVKCFPEWQFASQQANIIAPLAISFITFQTIAYLTDIYRGENAEKNICNFALFITFFPQLIQGPILRYRDFRTQLTNRITSSDQFVKGILRFLTGFNKKMLVADVLSELTATTFQAESLSVGMAWIGIIAYVLQIYFDFSGYSDMAVGLGRMFGFEFVENFDYPYCSETVSEFWRRWHITLGTWFRDYVYFPLGGSRVKKLRVIFNLMVVWLLTGVWHGPTINFILWGLWNGILIVIEKLADIPKRLHEKPVLQRLYRILTVIFIIFGFVFFRLPDLAQITNYFRNLFGLNGNLFIDNAVIFNSREYIVPLIVGIIGLFPIIRKLEKIISCRCGKISASMIRLVWFLILLVLAIFSVSSMAMSSNNPFMYMVF